MVKADLRKIVKVGSSLYVALTKEIVNEFELSENSYVKMGLLHGQAIIEPMDVTVEDKNYRHKVPLTLEKSNGQDRKLRKTVTAKTA